MCVDIDDRRGACVLVDSNCGIHILRCGLRFVMRRLLGFFVTEGTDFCFKLMLVPNV